MNYTQKADETLVSIAQQLQLHNTLTQTNISLQC